MTHTFRPGDLVVTRKYPLSSYTVTEDAGNMVWIRDNDIVALMSASALVSAPAGWRDAPTMPSGSVQFGLSERARQQKLANDNADPAYQSALQQWRGERLAWALACLAKIDFEAAEIEIAALAEDA